jgi:hypothetical protein
MDDLLESCLPTFVTQARVVPRQASRPTAPPPPPLVPLHYGSNYVEHDLDINSAIHVFPNIADVALSLQAMR